MNAESLQGTSQQQIAHQAVDRFVRRFHTSYKELAAYTALPLLLTPELVNFLRVQFLLDKVDWVAEVDLLLSDLCRQVGYELYAMDAAVRSYLLEDLARTHDGRERMQEVARLLLNYVKYLANERSYLSSEELEAQQWSAMVFLNDLRDTAVRQIAEKFQSAGEGGGQAIASRAEMSRLARLTQELAPQLRDYPPLIEYARLVNQVLEDPSSIAPETARRSRELSPGIFVRLPADMVPIPKKAKNYAIAIGIDRYVNLVSNLYAIKDAEDIHNWLSREAGFEQVRLFTDNSFPLVREPGNPESSQLTPELLARFLDETLKTLPMSVEDNLWFFFSGHGIRLENIDYLVLPANISDRVEDTAIPVSFIVEQLQRYGAGNIILFLDADRDLAASYSTNLRIVRNPQQEFGITAIAPPRPLPNRGTIAFYSSSPGEGACEIESLQHGAFTHAFLETLQQRKVGEAITVESLAQQLRDRVPPLTQQYNKPRQTPEVLAEPESKYRLVLLPPRTTISLQEFEFEIAEIVFEEESRIQLKTFQFQQANIEVQIFRSESHIRQDSRSYCNLSERLILSSNPINLEYIRVHTKCLSQRARISSN
jgi:uncharacterized caspase-like protein